jgi:hypothetical protein
MRLYRKVCLETEGVVLTMWSSRVHKLDEVEGGGGGGGGLVCQYHLCILR